MCEITHFKLLKRRHFFILPRNMLAKLTKFHLQGHVHAQNKMTYSPDRHVVKMGLEQK